eukprot:g32907.t1
MRDPDDAEAQADLKDHEVLEEASPSPQVFEVEDRVDCYRSLATVCCQILFDLDGLSDHHSSFGDLCKGQCSFRFAESKPALDQVTAFSKTIIDSIGMPGLFVAVLIGDGLPQPFTYVPLIFLAVKAQVPKSLVFGVCASGSRGWFQDTMTHSQQVWLLGTDALHN